MTTIIMCFKRKILSAGKRGGHYNHLLSLSNSISIYDVLYYKFQKFRFNILIIDNSSGLFD